MPIRQMKESSEQHLVVKAQANNPMNQVQKASKTSQNGKGLPPQEPPQNAKQPSHNPSPAKNRSRRRGRGVPRAGQGDTLSGLKSPTTYQIPTGCLENASHLGEPERGFPSSSKSLGFPPRPGLGQAGTRCIVKANHFFAELPDKDLIHYDVRKLICSNSLLFIIFGSLYHVSITSTELIINLHCWLPSVIFHVLQLQ